jgi:hypothetical protein
MPDFCKTDSKKVPPAISVACAQGTNDVYHNAD